MGPPRKQPCSRRDRSNSSKECATHSDLDFWYTALWKVRGGYLPDSACDVLRMALPVREERSGPQTPSQSCSRAESGFAFLPTLRLARYVSAASICFQGQVRCFRRVETNARFEGGSALTAVSQSARVARVEMNRAMARQV